MTLVGSPNSLPLPPHFLHRSERFVVVVIVVGVVAIVAVLHRGAAGWFAFYKFLGKKKT